MSPHHACGCGAVHTREQWMRLPLRYYFTSVTTDGVPFVAEARDCECGSTVSTPAQAPLVPHLIEDAVAREGSGLDEELAAESVAVLRATQAALSRWESRRLPYALEVSP